RDISGDTSQLIQSLQTLKGDRPDVIIAAAKRYVVAQPYTATSTLFFVLSPGVGTASNHPELFGGGPPEGGETEADQQIENAEGRRLKVPHLGYSTALVPDVGRTRIFEQHADLGTAQVIAGAGEPLALVSRAQHGVARAFALAGVVVLG